MRKLLTYRDYDVYVRPCAGELLAQIERPGRRRVAIAEIPAASTEAALRRLSKEAIKRDLTRGL